MSLATNKKKFEFWTTWTLSNVLSFIIASVAGYLFLLQYFTHPGYAMGTHLEESRNSIIFMFIVGIIVSTIQWLLLRKPYKVIWIWIIVFPFAIVIVDAVVFIVLGKLGIHWGEFLDAHPYFLSLLLLVDFLIIGVSQVKLLANHLSNTFYWIVASSAPWAIGLLITFFGTSSTIWLLYLVVGIFLYSASTGATLVWVMKTKESMT